MSYVSSLFASKNNPTKIGSNVIEGCDKMGEKWQERAKALFFMEKKSIREISTIILKSERSVYSYFKNLPEYKKEKEKRKNTNKQKRKKYQRQWDRQNRGDRYTSISRESLKREHDVAAMILSAERY